MITDVDWGPDRYIYNFWGSKVGQMIDGMDYTEGDFLYFEYGGASRFGSATAVAQILVRGGFVVQVGAKNYQMSRSDFTTFFRSFTPMLNTGWISTVICVAAGQGSAYLRYIVDYVNSTTGYELSSW